MQASISVDGQVYRWDPARFFDLSLPADFRPGATEAFGLPCPRAESLPGSSVQCATVQDLNPHTTTHLESALHLREPAPAIGRLLDRFHFLGTLVSLEPAVAPNGDRVLTAERLGESLPKTSPFLDAVIVRTLPHDPNQTRRRYTGSNPPYFEAAAAALLRARGVSVLLIDLPSLDREQDGGRLAAHRAFFGAAAQVVSADPRPGTASPDQRPRAVGELVHVPPELPDGLGLLHLVPLRWELDASPVRPIFHPVERIG